ncbi:26S proteasome regulatory subunit T5 [Paragonimus westermani]|uniref:26S proteasome regulatory subunit T5 n=1 Tax=Paragonimus westermani TaxID=34504 RepID=A0A5J4NP24_9TREM|nr:26S proteasome regulatory subunit T5 [Paragonimus westermani]
MTTIEKPIWDDVEEEVVDEVMRMSNEELMNRARLLDAEIRFMKSELHHVDHEIKVKQAKVKESKSKIKMNKALPYLVANVVEVSISVLSDISQLLDVTPQDYEKEDGANVDLDSQRKGKCAVIKTSTRQTYFLPVIGLVPPEELKPGDLVGVNKDSYLILEKLPPEFDSRVKAMEVDERPTERYSDIGGLDRQIQELIEAVVLPMTHKDRFEAIGIQPPKGVLLYGPPGTGKTLLARACAAQTKSTFLKLAGPQLVQMFIGDGAKLVRDAFQLAKEKEPSIIFIDELDAIVAPSKDVNYEELARCTDDFNGAQCKAVCVEAGMIALRRNASEITHEDYMDAILEVQAKKKTNLNYYA